MSQRWRSMLARWRICAPTLAILVVLREAQSSGRCPAGGLGGWFSLSAVSIRALFSDRAGNLDFFHLLRSAGSTRAVRANAASEQVQCCEYVVTALFLSVSELKHGLSEPSPRFGRVSISAVWALRAFAPVEPKSR
jgi:hypothetical protein